MSADLNVHYANIKRDAGAVNAESIAPLVANMIIEHAIELHASDIHIEPKPDGLVARFRIDGMLREVLTIPRDEKINLIPHIKVSAGIDAGAGGVLLPRDGRIRYRFAGQEADIRLNTFPTLFGEKVALRILVPDRDMIPLDKLGFYPRMLRQYEEVIRSANGMILVTGPTGSGKTTTLYVTLRQIQRPELNICTLEDPIEYEEPAYNQAAVNPRRGFTFADGLRALVRQDPDIILLGEIRDEETAEVALRAALTGHLMLSTLHTNDAGSTLARLFDMGIDPYLIANCLRAIVAQRLARRICARCAMPDPDGAKWFEEKKMIKDLARMNVRIGRGCRECFDSGWRGRVGLFELVVINDKMRDLIGKQASRNDFVNAAYKMGMPPLYHDALRKVADGLTSLNEALRLTMEFTKEKDGDT